MKRTSRHPAHLIGSAPVIVLSLSTVSAVRAQNRAPGQGNPGLGETPDNGRLLRPALPVSEGML